VLRLDSRARHVSGVTTANLDTVRDTVSSHCTRLRLRYPTDAQCEFMRFAAAGLDGTLQGYYTLPADLYVAWKSQSPVPLTHTRTMSCSFLSIRCYKLPDVRIRSRHGPRYADPESETDDLT
jgi:hypothetical protein